MCFEKTECIGERGDGKKHKLLSKKTGQKGISAKCMFWSIL